MALSQRSYQKLVVALLKIGAVLAKIVLIGLRSVFNYLGIIILLGLLIPLGVPGTDTPDFIG